MSKDESQANPEQQALLDYIEQVLDTFRDRFGFVHLNQPNPDLGVLDRERAAQLLAAAGREQAEYCLAVAGRDNANARNAMMLFRAVAGWNREDVLKSIQQRTQIAIRAFGLLPLPGGSAGQNECFARYLALREYEKVGLQFAAQRRATEQAAVQAALANLAQTAGFPDPTRLVWAMESELAKRAMEKPALRSGDVTLTLTGVGLDATVRATRGGTPLASIPSTVKKTTAYAELRARADELRAQHHRLCADFERLMVEEETFEQNELAELASLPVLGQLLDRLVFRDAAGSLGRYNSERNVFVSSSGDPITLEKNLVIAHPIFMEADGSLAEWQQSIVRDRIVQPFKQVFRETYTESPHVKLAGQSLSARAAGKWLNDQGWQMQLGDMPHQAQVFRMYWSAEIQVVVSFDEPARLLAGKGRVELKALTFFTVPARQEQSEQIPPANVPPLIRSEAYRDCDLLGAVAARGKSWAPSHEILACRGSLIAVLGRVAGLSRLRVTEDAATVDRSGGTYSVSLADASVTGPEAKPCEPPVRWSEAEDLHLPFIGSTDPTLAEIVNRVQWLCKKEPS